MHDFMKTIISAIKSWTTEKIDEKLVDVSAAAETQVDWNEENVMAYSYIKNKPDIESLYYTSNEAYNFSIENQYRISQLMELKNEQVPYSMTDIFYSDNKFVSVQSYSNYDYDVLFCSDDGISWQRSVVSRLQYGSKAIAYGNGKFVSIDGTYYRYSDDFINWVTRPTLDKLMLQNIIYYNGKFIAYDNSYVIYSEDGVTWEYARRNLADYPLSWISDMVCGNGKIVYISRHGRIVSSEDGVTWEDNQANIYRDGCNWIKISYGDGKFIAIDYDGKTACSKDCITWTYGDHIDCGYINHVLYGDGKFILIDNESAVFSSKDGMTWELMNPPGIKICAIAYDNEKFICSCYNDTKIHFSRDGINWSDFWSRIVKSETEDITNEVRELILNDITFATDDDILGTLSEMGYIDPISASDGSIYTNRNGEIYIL